MKVVSYNSRILNSQEQKPSTLDHELLGMVHARSTFWTSFLSDTHRNHSFTDHKPLLHCFTKECILNPRLYRAQRQLTKISKLEIIQPLEKLVCG